jgi:endo-1,4-beta-xylanase
MLCQEAVMRAFPTMPSPLRAELSKKSSKSRFLSSAILTACILLLTSAAGAQTVVQNDFEDGTLQGWVPRGTAILTNTTEVAHGGTHSLKTTGRTAGFHGPSLNITPLLQSGNIYQITAWVRLVAGQSADTLAITVQRTVNGSNNFDRVATSATGGVADSDWVMLRGTYSFSGQASLLLYIEATGSATQYYVDDFSIVQVPGAGCAVPPDNSGFTSDFEDSTTQHWTGRGSAAVSNSTADAHSGVRSLFVTNRTASWNGPTMDITGKMCNGSQYAVTFWVKMAPGAPQTTIRVSLQLTLKGVASFKTLIANAPVTSSSWVRFKVKPYTFSGSYDNLQIYVESAETAAPFASFYIDDASLQFMPPPVIENLPSIAQTYASDFLVGFATLQQDLLGAHGQLAALHYNSVTPGNDLKWDTTERTEGAFNFGPGDNILAFAQAHNIKMRGHTFVWHNQVPNWVFLDANGVDMSTEPYSDANKALLLSRLKNHITALINHYKDNIYVWDVVNEAIDESQTNGFRRSKWYTITVDPNNNPGYPVYMDDAFIYARQALDALGIGRDKVKLCYNDYNTTISAKRDFIYNWVKGAISRGVPIDCVGNQFHNGINFPIDEQGSAASKQNVIDAINLFNSLTSTAGAPIINEVTEFDMSLYRYGRCSQTFYTDYDDLLAGDQADLINEGYRYRDYFQIFKNLKDKIDSVTLWGLGDDDSWLNPSSNTAGCAGVTAADAPLPFDSYLQHKYAYTGIVNPLALPGANLSLSMTPSSPTVLSGSPLSYVITVTNNGPNDAASLTLSTSVPASTGFQSIAAPAGWTCNTPVRGGTGQLTCKASTLANGASVQFTLTTVVVCATPDATPIANSALVTSTTLNPNPTPNNSASASIQVSNPPPVISGLSVNPAVLWPPNHNMVNTALSYTITHHCDASIVPAIAVSSNQPVNVVGDGNTSSDWQVVDSHNVLLRSERAGNLGDRIYTITLRATDSAGAATTGSVQVRVPHDSGQ